MKNKEQIVVSAIITTHNRIKLLPRAIDSVLSQTYKNIELIVVNDSSDDGTKEMLSSYENITVINIPKSESHGANYARNLGINASKGDYVAFLDDDDYWLPTKIEKQVQRMEKGGYVIVSCGYIEEIIREDGRAVFSENVSRSRFDSNMSRKILYNIYLLTSLILIDKEALHRVGLFDEQLKAWQEYEMTIRMAQIGPFSYINEPLAVYRVDVYDTNRTTNKVYEWKQSAKYIYKKHKNLYDQLSFKEKIEVKKLYYRDGLMRAKNAGFRITGWWYSTCLKFYFRLSLLCNHFRFFNT